MYHIRDPDYVTFSEICQSKIKRDRKVFIGMTNQNTLQFQIDHKMDIFMEFERYKNIDINCSN